MKPLYVEGLGLHLDWILLIYIIESSEWLFIKYNQRRQLELGNRGGGVEEEEGLEYWLTLVLARLCIA